MMRLPRFTYCAPRAIDEAAGILAEHGDAMVVAGRTDVLPNMKRRQQTPTVLVGLRGIAELKAVANGDGLTIGAGSLADLLALPSVRERYTGLWQAVSQIATPHLRNMGTLGGNLCLDTRCNYYDQNYEWRKAIDFCMKKDGETCWVAPSSRRCLAVSSTDTAPMLVALGAVATLQECEPHTNDSCGGSLSQRWHRLHDAWRDELLTTVRPAGCDRVAQRVLEAAAARLV